MTMCGVSAFVLSVLTCSVLVASALVGCSQVPGATAKTPVEGLDTLGAIQVVAREEGSGTRDSFAQLLDFKGTNAAQDTSDLTTANAHIENSAESVMQAVGADASAIGYVSAASLHDGADVSQLLVDGVSTGADNYPLSRSFYLAYQEDVSELERDFLTYILGAGQGIVSENYTPVSQETSFLSNNESGTIALAGSTSVAPLLEELAFAYEEINPNATITITATDSTDGLTQALQGTCDIGMSSRDLKDYEKELLQYSAIAKDDIAVVVNQKNPLTSITSSQLKSIFVGDIETWEQLNE